ncbi:MAG TPA: hypothetical protein VHR46_02265 [Gaiella sp.]|jgi:hypothetical protein|nr:hypothetical protein [Gaiella sp.]
MTRIVALAASLAAVAALAVGAAAVQAADRPPLADDVAARLGIPPEKLRDAFRAALTARIDAAVAAGRLTPEQGAKLEARIANAKGFGLGIRKRFAQRQHAFAGRVVARGKALGAAATYLGLSRDALRAELAEGQSLAQMAKAKGKPTDGLVAAMVAPAKTALAKAVANGKLTQARADGILARLTERVEALVQRVPAKR